MRWRMTTANDFLYKEVHKTLKRVGVYSPTEETELRFLYQSIYHIAARVPNPEMYEYGTLAGASAICMGMGIQFAKELARARGNVLNSKLVTVDNYSMAREGKNPLFSSVEEVREKVILCGVESSVEVLEMDDMEHISTLENNSVNFAFVDSKHSYDHVSKTLELILPKMAKDAFLCGHDYTIKDAGVIYAVEDFRKKYPVSVCGFGIHHTIWWCMIRTPLDEIRRRQTA
jgi:predicted O-methyltransferase YrrM